jgi:hypothetical protein
LQGQRIRRPEPSSRRSQSAGTPSSLAASQTAARSPGGREHLPSGNGRCQPGTRTPGRERQRRRWWRCSRLGALSRPWLARCVLSQGLAQAVQWPEFRLQSGSWWPCTFARLGPELLPHPNRTWQNMAYGRRHIGRICL